MSSHREAPEIAKDPVADSTDVYAFVSPDKPGTVTLIANYIPLQGPAGGPNFYEFGDDVLYEIHVDNNGDGRADVSFQFRFRTTVRNPETFLYNTGPIQSLTSPNWNRRQNYDVTMASGFSSRTIGTGLACPPCNIGPLSTPDYGVLAAQAVHQLGGGITVFAGQRAEAFYVDLGSIFDLADLRPFANLHATFGLPGLKAGPGVNATNHLNVHSIAIQVPVSTLTRSGHPTIGVWTTAGRQRVRLWDADNGQNVDSGPFRQVSRLGNPLVNGQAEHLRAGRRRSRRLPERPPGDRRRGRDRAAGTGRRDVPADRHDVQARRGGGPAHRRADPGQRQRPAARPLPLPRGSVQRLQQPVMTEATPGPSGPGTVVMELGAGVGALILYTPASLDGEEIEISRDGAPRTHSRVRPRHLPGQTRYAAVYPGLPAGRYTIWRAHTPVTAVTVTGAQVSSCHWPG